MAYTLQVDVKRKPWMKQPLRRWNAGLVRAGMAFHNGLSGSHYPPIPAGSTYKRTYTLAHKAGFRIVSVGKEMEFGSTFYLPYLLAPARTVQHWAGKQDELNAAMKAAFAEGVINYKGEE